jgi:ribosome-associated protein
MADAIVITGPVTVPAAAIEVRAVRSSGPGGQNVNKVASKIELHVDLSLVTGLNARARARLYARAATRLDAEGRLLVTSQLTRDQGRNLEDAREKVRAMIAGALIEPKARKKTAPSRGSIERRIKAKKVRSQTKAARRVRDD